jgi:hypothetical protein
MCYCELSFASSWIMSNRDFCGLPSSLDLQNRFLFCCNPICIPVQPVHSLGFQALCFILVAHERYVSLCLGTGQTSFGQMRTPSPFQAGLASSPEQLPLLPRHLRLQRRMLPPYNTNFYMDQEWRMKSKARIKLQHETSG